jgi:hypothetical protein
MQKTNGFKPLGSMAGAEQSSQGLLNLGALQQVLTPDNQIHAVVEIIDE